MIELNVLHNKLKSIAIELTFVTLGHGFKKAGSVLVDIGDSLDKEFFFKSICISLYLHNWVVLRLCIALKVHVFAPNTDIGTFYWFEAGQKLVR